MQKLPIKNPDDIDNSTPKKLIDTVKEYIEIDFEDQNRDDIKFPRYPYMDISTYDKYAEKLAQSPAGTFESNSNVIGWINYSLSKNTNSAPSPKIVKIRQNTIMPLIKKLGVEKEYGEMVVIGLDGDIISFSLIYNPWFKTDREYIRAVYNLDGTPIKENKFAWKMFEQDRNAVKMVDEYFNNHKQVNESYSSPKPIMNRYSQVIGYIQTNNETGDQLLTDRFKQIKGWYKAKQNITVDRYSKLVGFGNLLYGLLDKKQ